MEGMKRYPRRGHLSRQAPTVTTSNKGGRPLANDVVNSSNGMLLRLFDSSGKPVDSQLVPFAKSYEVNECGILRGELIQNGLHHLGSYLTDSCCFSKALGPK